MTGAGAGAERTVAVAVATLWTGPDRPRDLDAPALSRPSAVREWTRRMTAQDRLDLHGRVESQALLGDAVVVLEEADRWCRVVVPSQPSSQDPRGYPGWIPAAQLTEAVVPAGSPAGRAVVRVPTTTLCAAPGEAPVMADVSFATVLGVAGPRGADPVWLPVLVPGRAEPAWVPAADVELDRPGAVAPADILAAAGQFLGLAYLWGGTCGLGLDCSGLVHMAWRRFGVTVPRDAHDQAARAGPDVLAVKPAEAAAGDLLFFAERGRKIHHVGICAGSGAMLHAPETGRGIISEPLSDRRRGQLVAARRWS